MIGHIYKITNDINDKVYIGKTVYNIEHRWKEHCSDYNKNNEKKRPLYNAMNKYGIEHFSISLIEECDLSILSNREIYWIECYHSYSNGYNATLGGDGKTLFDYDAIKELILKDLTYSEIADIIKCSKDTIKNIAKKEGLTVKTNISSSQQQMLDSKKEVYQYTKQGEYLNSFDSYAAAARWLVDNGYVKTYAGGVRTHISEAANGKRKSAYSFIWKSELI